MSYFTTSILSLALVAFLAAPLHGGIRVLNKEGVIGATTGGIVGGVIGHQSRHGLEGAIIGSVAGYAIGTTTHHQKQRVRDLKQQREAARQEVVAVQSSANEAIEAVRVASPPPLTNSERQQLLLQHRPLYRVQ